MLYLIEFGEHCQERGDRPKGKSLLGLRKGGGPSHETTPIRQDHHVSSDSFLIGAPGFIHYISSKGVVFGLTRGPASELGEYGIRVNTLAPGYTMTAESIVRTQGRPGWADMQRKRQALRERNELPEDLAGPALFLASDDSDFVTGQTLVVDAGVACW